MKTLIQKLENRQNMTPKALAELFELISELEENLNQDIKIKETENKVHVQAKYYLKPNADEPQWFRPYWKFTDDSFALGIENGKIQIKNIIRRVVLDNGYTQEFQEDAKIYSFNTDLEDRDILRVNFKELIIALEELMKLTIEEIERIEFRDKSIFQ